jgi:FkbM family methyltransferase
MQRVVRRVHRAIRAIRGRRWFERTRRIPTSYGELSAPDWSPVFERMCLGRWEPLQTRVFEQLVRDRVYWDLGAHVGWYVLVASHAGARRIFALEAAPTTFQHLARTVECNGISATLVHAALVDEATGGEVDFYVGQGADGLLYSSTHPVCGDFQRVRVPAIDLEQLVSHQHWEAPEVIKIDLEGSEPWIVPQILSRFRHSDPDLIAEVNFEACAAHGVFPFAFVDALLSTRHVFVVDESQARLRRLDDPRHVRHGDNVLALSESSWNRLQAGGLPRDRLLAGLASAR